MALLRKKSTLIKASTLLVGLILLLGCTSDQETAQVKTGDLKPVSPDSKDVPYVRSPQMVVDRMLELAGVSEDDIVYDLGSGDGRFVITAAQQFGARGVGIEIDPELVRDARENADFAGVSNQVEFRQEDLFEADFSDATVVTLYLLPTVNLKLRPTLFEQLEPGDRVVSHDFNMGEWKPDSTEMVGEDRIYLWRIPETPPDFLQEDGE